MDDETVLKKVVLTVWKDGTFQVWGAMDATYAQGDPGWLINIGFEELNSLLAQEKESQSKFAPAIGR
uniref:hypothetical protein n=1 Tax=Trichocoleus desertorum TaxID=1481672 RepID=UPI0025B3C56C|nr:hypothetical protein [Trichocoleus desertorum]